MAKKDKQKPVEETPAAAAAPAPEAKTVIARVFKNIGTVEIEYPAAVSVRVLHDTLYLHDSHEMKVIPIVPGKSVVITIAQ